jgi:two-component system NtrC family sensor kinase
MHSRPTVLTVDDDPDVAAVVADIFDMLGYDVVTADCPRAALEVLRTMGDRIGLIFTDLVMPEMDGKTFAVEARALVPDIRIVFTSGQMHAMPDAIFVPKPFTIEGIGEAVERARIAGT